MTKKIRKKAYTDLDKEKVFALYAVSGNYSRVAKETGIPISTVKSWVDKENDDTDDSLVEKRTKKREEFAQRCWEPILQGVELINRQMHDSLDKQAQLEKLLDVVTGIDDKDISYKEKVALMKKIEKIQRPDMRELTAAIATLYDKQALVRGEATASADTTIKMVGDVSDWAK